MTYTLRRSRSKYGRTRKQRQQRRQRRTRGGGGFFDTLIEKITPSTPQQKCVKAKEDARLACSNVDGDIEMTEMGSEKEPTSQNYATTINDEVSSSPYQDMDSAAAEELASNPRIMPLDNNNQDTLPLGGEQPLPGGEQPLPGGEQPLPSSLPPQTVTGGSRRKKNKNNNKKRNQSRRKKTKSKKHKK
jgi:hypothetical protein